MQVVNAKHVVGGYRYRGSLSAVGFGTRVRFRSVGSTIKHLTVEKGQVKSVQFLGRVISAHAGQMTLRLADKRIVHVKAKVVHSGASGGGVVPGQVLLITESRRTGKDARGKGGGGGAGGATVTASPVSSTSETGTPQVDGTVVELDASDLAVQSANGTTTSFTASPTLLANLQASICDTVTVAYHRSGSTNVADTVVENDDDATAACNNAGDGPDADAPPGQDVDGTITKMTLTTVSIATADGGAPTFTAGVALTGDYLIGDDVDVTYNTASDGSLLASDIEYNDQDAVGMVTDVSAGSITIVDSNNQFETFTDDPSNETFDGINEGDQVDVSYHLSNGKPVVDSVSDLTNPD
jgi:hypothetical protein